jgi:hypothetical protein
MRRVVRIGRFRAAVALSVGFGLASGAVLCASAGQATPPDELAYEVTEVREPCADHDPLRNAYFGDIHVHTSFSQDARASGSASSPTTSAGSPTPP